MKIPKELIKEYVKSDKFTSTTDWYLCEDGLVITE